MNILLSTRTSNEFRPSPSLFSSSSTQRLESESDLELDFNSADKSFASISNIVKDEKNNDGEGRNSFDVRVDRRIFDNATARARPTAGVAWDARVDVTI